MADETKTIRIVVDASRAVDGSAAATRALQNLDKTTGDMSSSLKRMEDSLLRVGGYLKAQIALYAVEAAARLLEMGKQAFEAAAGLDELAQKVGLSARNLQGLQFLGVQSGASLDDITIAATKFSIKMGEAAEGSKEVIESLKMLGVQNLDAQGQLRPTADLMAELAQKILAIEDPARRSAAMVAFFGKSGTTMTAGLEEMAKGLGNASIQAQRFGAMIGDDTIKRLDALADSMDRGKLRTRAFMAEGIGALLSMLDSFTSSTFFANMEKGWNGMLQQARLVPEALGDGLDALRAALDAFAVKFVDTLAGIPRGLGNMIVSSMNAVIAALETSVNAIAGFLKDRLPWLGSGPGSISIPRLTPFEAAPSINAGGQYTRDYAGERAAARALARQASMEASETAARVGSLDLPANPWTGLNSKGSGYSAVKSSGGENEVEKLNKLKSSLTAAAEAQEAMTAAARAGDVAFQTQQANADALAKAIDFFGGKVSATSPEVKQLASELEKLILRQKEGAAAQAFVVATTELEKQNVLLEAQLRLMNEAPEVQAREIAMIKAKQDAQKAGQSLDAADIENRRMAIEQNETLKVKAEQLKQTNELMLEPVRQAFRSIQQAGADAWERILETGDFTMKSLLDTVKITVRRMAAEFLALATVRPVLSVLVSAVTGAGILSPASAGQMGFPQATTGSAVSRGGGAGSGLLSSIGGLNIGGLSNWLNAPISGFPSAGAFEGVLPGMTGAQAQQYFGGISGAGMFGTTTWGQGLGALAGAGMGIYNLVNSKSTGQTLGGIGSLIGAGVSLIPGIGQIAGPIIGLASALLPSLFGGGPQIPEMPGLGYSFNAMPAASLNSLLAAAGGRAIPGALFRGGYGQGTNHIWDGSQWAGTGYTEASITNPRTGQTYGIGGGIGVSPETAADQVAARAFQYSVNFGAITGLNDTLVKLMKTVDVASTQIANDVITFSKSYDALGKAANPVRDAIDKLSQQMDELRQSATTYGLSLDPINAELKKQTRRTAQDFIDNMLDPLAVQLRALSDERDSALASAQYIKDNVADVFVDMARVAEFYTNKEAALREQFYQGGVASLEALIRRLTYGDLANASPDTSLAGTRATYNSTLAQARAGNATAISNLAGVAEAYSSTARSYWASGPEYVALIAQIRKDLAETVAVATGGVASAGAAANLNQASAESVALVANLADTVQQQSDQITELKNMVTALVAQLRNQNSNRMF